MCCETNDAVTMEKRTWKIDMIQKSSEIESLESNAKKLSAQRMELSSRIEQLLVERKELENEVTDLGLQVCPHHFIISNILMLSCALIYTCLIILCLLMTNQKSSHAASQIEDLHAQLACRQTEIDKLSEKCHQLRRDFDHVNRDAKTNADIILSLRESIRLFKSKNEQLEMSLNDTRDQLADSQVCQHKLQTMCDCLQVEIKGMVDKHKDQISNRQNKIVATLKQQHFADNQNQEKLIDSLRRANSLLENDRARYERDRQSLEHRCETLEKLLANGDNKQQEHLNELLHRAAKSEDHLNTSRSMEKEWKKKVVLLEEKVTALQNAAKDKEVERSKYVEGLQKDLNFSRCENQLLSNQLQSLKEELEKTCLQCAKDKQTMQHAMEQRMRDAEVECEALRAGKKIEMLKTKESQNLHEKQLQMQQGLLDKLKVEKKELRIELEKTISDEREVSQVCPNGY